MIDSQNWNQTIARTLTAMFNRTQDYLGLIPIENKIQERQQVMLNTLVSSGVIDKSKEDHSALLSLAMITLEKNQNKQTPQIVILRKKVKSKHKWKLHSIRNQIFFKYNEQKFFMIVLKRFPNNLPSFLILQAVKYQILISLILKMERQK